MARCTATRGTMTVALASRRRRCAPCPNMFARSVPSGLGTGTRAFAVRVCGSRLGATYAILPLIPRSRSPSRRTSARSCPRATSGASVSGTSISAHIDDVSTISNSTSSTVTSSPMVALRCVTTPAIGDRQRVAAYAAGAAPRDRERRRERADLRLGGVELLLRREQALARAMPSRRAALLALRRFLGDGHARARGREPRPIAPTSALSMIARASPSFTLAPTSTLSARTTPGERALTWASLVAS